MAQKKDTFFLAAKSGKKTDRPKKGTFKKRTEENKIDEEISEKAKKPFDKKAYRFKKYSNKYKLDKWEDQRKKRLLRTYYKDVKNDAPLGSYKPVNFDEDLSNSDEETQGHDESNETKSGIDVPDSSAAGRFVRHPDLIEAMRSDASVPNLKSETKGVLNSKSAKKNAFRRAKEEMERLKLSKEEKRRELDRSKEEREQKLNEYRKKKAERFKKLSRKTKKGQPVMTGRLELLLEKIVSNK